MALDEAWASGSSVIRLLVSRSKLTLYFSGADCPKLMGRNHRQKVTGKSESALPS